MKPRNLPSNPFVGLRSYQKDESLIFFGRDKQAIKISKLLQKERFVAIIGESGAGKSSLVRAALIPFLEGGFLINNDSGWDVLIMNPGVKPISVLINTINSFVKSHFLEKDGPDDPTENDFFDVKILTSQINSVLEDKGTNCLLIIDQFEEIFRNLSGDTSSEVYQNCLDFIDAILYFQEQTETSLYVIITMRSEYIGSCSMFAGLAEIVSKSQFLVPRLSQEQIRKAVVGPIKLFGSEISENLLTEVLKDSSIYFDQLPLLQYALMRTWENAIESRSKPRILSSEDYSEIGSLKDALNIDLERIYTSLTPSDKELAKLIFTSIVTIDNNGNMVRNPLSLSKLQSITSSDQETIINLIGLINNNNRCYLQLTNTQITTFNTLDITHESITRQWYRLKEWLDNLGRSKQFYSRLLGQAKLHQESRGELLSGLDLERADSWYKESNKQPTSWNKHHFSDIRSVKSFIKKSHIEEQKQILSKRRTKYIIVIGSLMGIALIIASLSYANNVVQLANRTLSSRMEIRSTAGLNNNAKLGHSKPLKETWISSLITLQRNQLDVSTQSTPFSIGNLADLELRFNMFPELWVSASNHSPSISPSSIQGHQNHVYDVEFHPSGNSFATCSIDKTIKIWNTSSLELMNTLEGHKARVSTISYSPNGKLLVSGGEDKTVIIWDLERNIQLGNIELPEDILCVEFSPIENVIAIGLRDNTVRLLDLQSLQVKTIYNHQDQVYSVAFHPSGRYLVSGGKDKFIILMDLKTLKSESILGHEDTIRDVSFSNNGKFIATASRDRLIKVWDFKTLNLIKQLNSNNENGHTEYIRCVEFSPDDKLLASSSDDNSIIIWDFKTESIQAKFDEHNAWVLNIDFNPNGESLLSGGRDNTFRIWQLALDKYSVLKHPTKHIKQVKLSASGEFLASIASNDDTIDLVHLRDNFKTDTLSGHAADLNCIDFEPTNKMLVSGSINGSVFLWKLSKNQNWEHEKIYTHLKSVSDVAWSPTGEYLASTSEGDSSVCLWSMSAQSIVKKISFKNVKFVPYKLKFSSSGTRLAVTYSRGRKNHVRIFTIPKLSNENVLEGHTDIIGSLEFIPNSNLLLTGSNDNRILMWDIIKHNTKPLKTFSGHSSHVFSLAVDKSGKFFFSGSQDNTIRCWNIETGKTVAIFTRHSGAVKSLSLSDNNLILISGSSDRSIRFWDLNLLFDYLIKGTRSEKFQYVYYESKRLMEPQWTRLENIKDLDSLNSTSIVKQIKKLRAINEDVFNTWSK